MSQSEADLSALTSSLQSIGADIVTPGAGDDVSFGIDEQEPPDAELDILVDEDGVVEFAAPLPPGFEDNVSFSGGEDIERFRVQFNDLPGNSIYEAIANLDAKKTPNQGLRTMSEQGVLVPAGGPVPGRVLLIVHGTFSNAETVLGGIEQGDPQFIAWARQHYAQILTFDYATMSRQAISNAMALSRVIAPWAHHEIDVVCHSQGGLVTRYWLEVMEPHRLATTRSVFAASTLAGTSLAAPPALRQALGMLASVAKKIATGAKMASGAIPLFGYVAGLFGILEKTLGFVSKTPMLDAGVGLIPGFVGMSRVGNNAELDELRRRVTGVPPGYFAITGDFDAEPLGWKFWKRFVSRVADGAADLLFQGPNDLIVDTVSQTELSDSHRIGHGDPSRVLSYHDANHTVHHTNYFEQPQTLQFIRNCLHRG